MATGATGRESRAGSPADRFAALWGDDGLSPPDVFAFLRENPGLSARERLSVLLVDQRERWRAGAGRSVEEYLGGEPEVAADPELAAELIRAELNARRERGEEVDAVALASRVPLARLAETEDLPPRARETRDSGPHETEPDLDVPGHEGAGSPGHTVTSDGMPTLVVGEGGAAALGFRLNAGLPPSGLPGDPVAALAASVRFTVQNRLGGGGMGIVYQAFDHERGEPVALKTMRRVDPLALYRFKQEFRTLADLSHPNLVNLHELIAEGNVW